MTKTNEDKWRSLIAAQEKSGLGVRDFAASHGLAPATMYWWRCRLRDRSTALVPVTVVGRDDSAVSRGDRKFKQRSRTTWSVCVRWCRSPANIW